LTHLDLNAQKRGTEVLPKFAKAPYRVPGEK